MAWSLKKFLKLAPVQTSIAFILAAYIRGVYYLTPWTHCHQDIPLEHLDAHKPFIVCFWHGRLMMLPFAWHPKRLFFKPFYMLISGHSDGKLISRIVQFLGIRTISGSSTRGGDLAFRAILTHLRKNHVVGITPDGPNGPPRKVKMGIIHAAYYAQCDIIPVTFSASNHKIWGSWDSFFWAFPSKKGSFLWGSPIQAPKTKTPEGFEQAKQSLEAEMRRITDIADAQCGGAQPS